MNDPYPSLEKMERKRYPPYGECIYCGATHDLTTEHIIPYGLSGTLELPQSSCARCATETSRFERVVLQGELRPVRVFRALRSRRKHKGAPELYPLVVLRNGREETVELPLNKYPVLVPFPDFTPPRIAVGVQTKVGIDVAGITTVSFGANPAAVLQELGATSIKPSVETHPAQFARMVAKIGYAMAAATGALSALDSPSPIRDVILGRNTHIGDYVGTLTYPPAAYEGQLHRVAVLPDTNSGQLVADVQLFSDSYAPRYGVLLGKLRGGTTERQV